MSTADFYFKQLEKIEPRTYKKYGYRNGEERINTVADAVAFCEANGLDLSDAKLSHAFVSWEYTETQEEVDARIERVHEQLDKHLAAIKNMYANYVETGLITEDVHDGR